jgi:UDP-glucose 4-epimerase
VDWVFVDDVVEGLARIGARPDLGGATVDLGSGSLATVREVVEILFNLLAPESEPRFGAHDDRSAEQVRRAATRQTERQLGWRPATDLRAGLTSTVDWYRKELESGRIRR